MSSLDIFTAAATALNRLTARLANVDEVDDNEREAEAEPREQAPDAPPDRGQGAERQKKDEPAGEGHG